jgi:hypothetical protein
MNTALIDKARQGRLAALEYRGLVDELPRFSNTRRDLNDSGAADHGRLRLDMPAEARRRHLTLLNFA